MNKYDSYNFKRKLKTKKVNTSSYSPVETPCSTRRILSTVNLHQCQTLPLDKRVRKMAQQLVDTKLLAKLSEGDMIATKAKYLKDYTMSIVITAQRNLRKIVLWKSFKVHFII